MVETQRTRLLTLPTRCVIQLKRKVIMGNHAAPVEALYSASSGGAGSGGTGSGGAGSGGAIV